MIGLLQAEVRRFTARRLMRILGIAMLAALVLVMLRVAMVSSSEAPPDPRQQSTQEQQEAFDRQVERCEFRKAQGDFPQEIDCAQFAEQNSSMFIEREPDRRVHGKDALPAATTSVAVAVALIAFVCAASFVGADWHAGTMQALLFWEPRRGRVLFAKAVAVVVSVVGFLFAIEVVTYLLVYLLAATRGTTEGVTGGLHMANLLLVLRAAVFVSVVALLGYAIAGLSRFTGAALGVAFVYFAIIENMIYGFRPTWERWLISRNVAAILAKKVNVHPATRQQEGDPFGGAFLEFLPYQLTGVRGATTLGVYLAILLGAYYLLFTRRDVT